MPLPPARTAVPVQIRSTATCASVYLVLLAYSVRQVRIETNGRDCNKMDVTGSCVSVFDLREKCERFYDQCEAVRSPVGVEKFKFAIV